MLADKTKKYFLDIQSHDKYFNKKIDKFYFKSIHSIFQANKIKVIPPCCIHYQKGKFRNVPKRCLCAKWLRTDDSSNFMFVGYN